MYDPTGIIEKVDLPSPAIILLPEDYPKNFRNPEKLCAHTMITSRLKIQDVGDDYLKIKNGIQDNVRYLTSTNLKT
jgi:hypothetical protein